MFRKLFHGEQKYYFNPKSFSAHRYWDYSNSIYVELNDQNKVVASDNPLWSKAPKEKVHLIYVPFIWHPIEPRLVIAKLSQKVNSSEISVDVRLSAYFVGTKDKEVIFDPQDLYDNITAQGYQHLDDLIRESFLKATRDNPAIKQTFVDYAEHERPVQFIEKLTQAIQQLNFSGKLLKNMQRIDVRVDFNTVTATLNVSFNGS